MPEAGLIELGALMLRRNMASSYTCNGLIRTHLSLATRAFTLKTSSHTPLTLSPRSSHNGAGEQIAISRHLRETEAQGSQ